MNIAELKRYAERIYGQSSSDYCSVTAGDLLALLRVVEAEDVIDLRYITRLYASYSIDPLALSDTRSETLQRRYLRDRLANDIAEKLIDDLSTVDASPYGERTSIDIDVLTMAPLRGAHSTPVIVSSARKAP